LNTTKFFRAFR